MQGIRPNIVHKFTGKDSNILAMAMLIVRKLPEEFMQYIESDETKDEILDIVNEMLPPNATFMGSNTITIDTEPSAWIKYYIEQERVGFTFRMYVLQYVLFYQGKIFIERCRVGGEPDGNKVLEDAFTSYQPVFQLIGNSIVINDRWTELDTKSYIH